MVFKSFLHGGIPIWALGSLGGELGSELKAFKAGTIPYPHKIMEAFSKACGEISCDALAYVPSNKSTVMSFFAKECASLLGVSVWEGLRYARPAREQKFLASRRERQENVSSAFEVIASSAPMRLLLLDDVFASGETLSEVLALLKKNGIRPIAALVFALREDFLG